MQFIQTQQHVGFDGSRNKASELSASFAVFQTPCGSVFSLIPGCGAVAHFAAQFQHPNGTQMLALALTRQLGGLGSTPKVTEGHGLPSRHTSLRSASDQIPVK